MAEDRLSQEGRDKREYPNPRLAPKWFHPSSYPLNRVWRQSSNVKPLTMGSSGYSGLAADKGLECGEAPLLNEFMFSSRGERRTTALGGTGDLLAPVGNKVKLEEFCIALANPASHVTWIANSSRMHVALRNPWPMKLFPLI